MSDNIMNEFKREMCIEAFIICGKNYLLFPNYKLQGCDKVSNATNYVT